MMESIIQENQMRAHLLRTWTQVTDDLEKNIVPLVSDDKYEDIVLQKNDADTKKAINGTIRECELLKRQLKEWYPNVIAGKDTDIKPGGKELLRWYCREIWIAEQNLPDNNSTTHAVAIAVEETTGSHSSPSVDLIENVAQVMNCELGMFDYLVNKVGYETANMKRVMKFCRKISNIVLTTKDVFIERTHREFNIQTSHAVHSKLMSGLLKDSELVTIRTRDVDSGVHGRNFLKHERCQEHLDELFRFVKEKKEEILSVADVTDYQKFENLLVLGSIFLVEFLGIHPYVNGNGRTARILFSLLVSDLFNAVPISLFRAGPKLKRHEERKLYINTLECSRAYSHSAMVRWVFQCTISHLSQLALMTGYNWQRIVAASDQTTQSPVEEVPE